MKIYIPCTIEAVYRRGVVIDAPSKLEDNDLLQIQCGYVMPVWVCGSDVVQTESGTYVCVERHNQTNVILRDISFGVHESDIIPYSKIVATKAKELAEQFVILDEPSNRVILKSPNPSYKDAVLSHAYAKKRLGNDFNLYRDIIADIIAATLNNCV